MGYVEVEKKERWVSWFLESLFIPAISTLKKIPTNEVVKKLKIFATEEDKEIRKVARYILDELLASKSDREIEYLRRNDASRAPARLVSDNLNLADLINELHESEIASDRYWIIDTILAIDFSNQVALDTLDDLLNDCQDDWVRWLVAHRILSNDKNSEKAIQSLVNLLHSSHYDIPWRAAESLGEFGLGSYAAIKGLVGILKDVDVSHLSDIPEQIRHEHTLAQVALSLTKIIQHDSFEYVINQLSTNISYKALSESFSYYRWCHNILWSVSQEINYQAFHEAWHVSFTKN
jgi:HEAT repeat protein